MPKKPYIKKKEAVTYHLIHQSVLDEGTSNPHKMFLHEVQPANVKDGKKDDTRSQYSMRSKQSARSARSSAVGFRDDESVGTSVVSMGRFRPDDYAFGEYGFQDDGYDYTQHFRPRGNGRFIAAVGVPLSPAALAGGPAADGGLTKQSLAQLLNQPKAVELPKELFGGQTFSAQTRIDFTAEDDLPPALVPPEIDELLEKEEDPAKEDELEDDFVMLADGGEGFDEFNNPDQEDDEFVDDDDDLPELEKPKMRQLHLDAEGKLRDHDGNEVHDALSGDDELSGEAIESIQRPVHAVANKVSKNNRRRAPLPLPTEPAKPNLIDKRFDAVARAYADEEIGELEEDERTRGGADISQFEGVLDEFLQNKEKERIKIALPKKAAAPTKEEKAKEEDVEEFDEEGDEEFEEGAEDEDDFDEAENDEEEEEEPAAKGLKPKPVPPKAATTKLAPLPKPAASSATRGPAPLATPAPSALNAAAELKPVAAIEPPAASLLKHTAEKKTPAVVMRHQANGDDSDEDGDEEEEKEEYEVIELRERANWDCESIISTYSNTENHPAMIADPGKRIQLSKKTGMPLGVLPTKKKPAVAPAPKDNLGQARRKGETAEEKKARKAAIKEARRVARERNKEMGSAFKEEERTQLNATRGQPMGRSVIHMD